MNTPDPLNDPRFQDVLSKLRAQPAPEPSAGFTARTLARRDRSRASAHVFIRRAAALLAVGFGASLWFIRPPAPPAGPQALSPVDILMAAQRPDGGWSADARQPRHRYDTGVTALALLALMHSHSAPLQGPVSGAIRAGVNHLLREQRPDGRLGDELPGAGFTSYLAGMALQTASRLPGADPAWRLAADRARPHLPTPVQMARLNQTLSRPDTFPSRWADAGGPVAQTAIELLKR